MPRLYELTSELASLRSDWREFDRTCDELPFELHLRGLMHIAMTRLEDRIEVVERNIARAEADQAPRFGAAA